MHRKKYRYLRNLIVKKPLILISIIVISLILGLLINMIFDRNYDRQIKIIEKNGNLHSGSAVRKETEIRKQYEKDYRKKDKDWQKKYGEILENKEKESLKEIDEKLKKKTLD